MNDRSTNYDLHEISRNHKGTSVDQPFCDQLNIDERSFLNRGRVQSALIEKIKSLRGHTFSFYLLSGKFDRILNCRSSCAFLQSDCRDRHSRLVHCESASLGVGQSFGNEILNFSVVNVKDPFVGFVASEGIFRPNDKIATFIDIAHARVCIVGKVRMKHEEILCFSGCDTDFFTFVSDHVNESVSYRFCSYVKVFFSCVGCCYVFQLLNTVYTVQLYKLYGIYRTKTDVVI
jgi:hypothetical protein